MADNNTGTELEILKNIEDSYKRSHGDQARRNTMKSREWFRKNVTKNFSNPRKARLTRDKSLLRNTMTMGKLYNFYYDPKHKNTLPLYDTFPLVVPFSAYKASNGDNIILGLNFHYLRPVHRKIAFEALLKFRNEKRFRKSTKFNFDWQVIMALSQSKFFEHAVHAYNEHHFRSKFIEYPAQSWELIMFLPTANFVKGSKRSAWKM